MWTRGQLKRNALVAFERNRWTCVLVCFLATMLGGVSYGSYAMSGDSEEMQAQWKFMRNMLTAEQWREVIAIVLVGMIFGIVLALAIILFVSNLATVGKCRYFLENREHKTAWSQLFYGYTEGRYKYVVKTMGRSTLITFGYSFLFLVPGIIKSYSYRMVPYILAESPYMDSQRALQLSEEMMRGHKWESFVFELTFIGWKILGAFTMGILTIIHVEPYISASFAEYYTALKSEAIHKGIASYQELPGVRVEQFE